MELPEHGLVDYWQTQLFEPLFLPSDVHMASHSQRAALGGLQVAVQLRCDPVLQSNFEQEQLDSFDPSWSGEAYATESSVNCGNSL